MDKLFGNYIESDIVPKNKNIDKIVLKMAMEIVGLNKDSINEYIIDNKISIVNNETLKEVYKLCTKTKFTTAMYLYDSGPSAMIPLDSTDMQYSILSSCNRMYDELKELHDEGFLDSKDKQKKLLQYAMYFVLYIKALLVDIIPDLSCDVCQATRAKEYTFESLMDEIKDNINTSENYQLYRIIAKIMGDYDERDKASQLFSLLYDWFGYSDDLIFQLFYTEDEFKNTQDVLDRISNIDSYLAKMLKSYILECSDQIDKCIEVLKEVSNTIMYDTEAITFSDITHMISAEQSLEAAYTDMEDDVKATEHTMRLEDSIDTVKYKQGDYFALANTLGISYEMYCGMIDMYLTALGIDT